MKPIAIINKTQADFLNLEYSFTNVCNYKCNYCWPYAHSGTSRWPDYDKVCKSFDHIISVYKNDIGKKKIRLHFQGGEPTLWPKLGEFAKFIYEKHDCRITMSTNGSRTLRWWEEYSDYFDDVMISVHHEFCDIEHIKSVADLIYNKKNTMVSAAVMMDPKAWHTCKDMLDNLISHPVPWLVKSWMLVDENDHVVKDTYSKEDLEFLEDKIKRIPPADYIEKMKSLGAIQLDRSEAYTYFDDGTRQKFKTFDIMSNHMNNFYGWTCNLVTDRLVVQADGEIYGSCGQRTLFDIGTLNIFDDDFIEKFTKDVIKPVKCQQLICSCNSDVKITKYKNAKPE
jgi:organic radical activating enzyme